MSYFYEQILKILPNDCPAASDVAEEIVTMLEAEGVLLSDDEQEEEEAQGWSVEDECEDAP